LEEYIPGIHFYPSRNLKMPISKQKRAEIKKKKEEKEAERKKYTFMQRIQISRMKNM